MATGRVGWCRAERKRGREDNGGRREEGRKGRGGAGVDDYKESILLLLLCIKENRAVLRSANVGREEK